MKKVLQNLFIYMLPVILFTACEKELSFEAGTVAGTAVFSFDGGTGNCPGAVISGSYVAGVALTASNAATISVNVTTAGTYSISTNTVNGVTFSGAGSFGTTGTQIITLTAAGTPASSGSFNFTPGTTGCTFSVIVASGNGTSSGTASFTYTGGSANCTGAVLDGIYTTGTALTISNTVTLQVTVDTVGTYSVSTAAVNGITFIGSGTFITTGVQTIILNGTGVPVAAGSYNYKVGNNGCSFTVSADGIPLNTDCKLCVYVPTCVGSIYKYQTEYFGTSGTTTNEYLSATDTVVNGLTYSKMTVSADNGTNTSTSSSYVNCNNGVSSAYAYNVVGINGSTVAFIKFTGLKANEPIGTSWVENIQNQAGQNVKNTLTITEKGISRTVLGKAFPDVIHVQLVQTIDLLGTEVESGTSEYYYAKGVGLIEFTSINFGASSSQLLETYFIP